MKNYLVDLETAILLKERGYSAGSYNSFTIYHTDYIYDDDINHPESHLKGQYREHDNIFIINMVCGDNENINYTSYERPSLENVREWLWNYYIFVSVNTFGEFNDNTQMRKFLGFETSIQSYNTTTPINYKNKFLNIKGKNYEYKDVFLDVIKECLKRYIPILN